MGPERAEPEEDGERESGRTGAIIGGGVKVSNGDRDAQRRAGRKKRGTHGGEEDTGCAPPLRHVLNDGKTGGRGENLEGSRKTTREKKKAGEEERDRKRRRRKESY